MNGRQFIYHMEGLTKTYPPAKKVLDNIHLSFYPDAKIGVLGVNGSGKSTLLRIMAGIDTEFTGEGWVAEGARVGYLEQEPQLDPKKTVRENVMEGVAAKKALLDRYNEIAANYSDETAEEMSKLQDEIDSKEPLGSRQPSRPRHGRACAARRTMPTSASSPAAKSGASRSAGCCSTNRNCLLLDEPTNHLDAESVNWLEGHLRNYPGAILIVTHDRYFLDNVTGWILELDHGRGIPYEGNYTSWLGAKTEAHGAGRPRGRGAPANPRTRKRMDFILAKGAPIEIKGALRALRGSAQDRQRQGQYGGADHHPGGRAAGAERHRLRPPDQGLRRQSADRRPDLQAAARRHRRRHRSERRRQDDAVPHDHRAGKARQGHNQGRRQRASRLRRPVARFSSTARRTSGRKSPAGRT